MSTLSIYKASAGSGKTYTLTYEYIKLLFADTFNFKKTLAVTFTNKASGEMKTRIVRELNKLAISNTLAEDQKSGYLTDLCELYDKSEIQIQTTALYIQNVILHNYSSFNIETIDSFFQRVVQNFAKELGIYGGYSIELDSNMVIEKAIDLLFMDLDSNKELRKWLTTFSEEKIDEGKNRDIVRELKLFSQEIFKEDFTNIPKEIKQLFNDKTKLFEYFKTVKTVPEKYTKELQKLGNVALELIKNQGLTIQDFPYKASSFAAIFLKASKNDLKEIGKRQLEAVDNPHKWYAKTSTKRAEIEAAFHGGLNTLLKETIDHFNNNIDMVNTAQLILKNSFTLGMLADIAERIANYCEEEGIFLLSNNNKLLKHLIDENDTPFIYEKIGSFLSNMMIDEFQDTSQMQWGNFKPLIANCIAEGGKSLVVGDVKQSIYRWRNGDWKILANQIYDDFAGQTEDKILNNNWRSFKKIIEFNNSFFAYSTSYLASHFVSEMEDSAMTEETAQALASKLVQAYENSYQHAPAKSPDKGYVEFVFDQAKNNTIVTENALEYTATSIEKLQANGFEAKDIAILVRTNAQAKAIADFFQTYKTSVVAKPTVNYEIVSNEALLLTSSSAVNFIINFLQYLASPSQEIPLACIKHFAQTLQNNGGITHQLFNNGAATDKLIGEFIPKAHRLSLFELTEQIIMTFKLDHIKNETPFIQAFQDAINEFTIARNSSIARFLEWWDEKGRKLCVSISDQQNAIKLMTVHKSKGLEFKAVILPFATWDLMESTKAPILWCEPTMAPFDLLPLVPVKAESKMKNSLFAPYYFNEKLQSYIDSINIIYVAFTRAEQALFLYAKHTDTLTTTAGLLEGCLKNWQNIKANNIENLPLISFPRLEENGNTTEFKYGELPRIEKDKSTTTTGVNLNIYPSYQLGKKIILATHGLDFFEDFGNSHSKKEIGVMLHGIFENINTTADIVPAIEKAIFEGKLNKEHRNSLTETITQLTNKPEVKGWFTAEYEIKNEQAILLKTGKTKRPDRVMIQGDTAIVVDYKFTTEQSPKHGEQIKEYIDLLNGMGYKTTGFIWYILTNQLIELQ